MHAQETRDEPARTVDAYRRDGSVLWFGDLPSHPAVHTALDEGEPEMGRPYLVIERLPRVAPPVPGKSPRTLARRRARRPGHSTRAPRFRHGRHRRVSVRTTSGRTGRDPRRPAGDRRGVPAVAGAVVSLGRPGTARQRGPRPLQHGVRHVRERTRSRRGTRAHSGRRRPGVDTAGPSVYCGTC